MAKASFSPGSTSVMVRITVLDSTSTVGAGKTGLTAASFAGTKCYVARDDDGNAAGTAVTLTDAIRGTWSSGGIKEKDATNMPGVYELGLTDASLAAGSKTATYIFTGTGIVPVRLEIDLTNQSDVTRLNGVAASAANLERSASVIHRGSITGAVTATTLIDSGLTQASTDFWKGRIVIFTSGTLTNQATDITAFDPATDKLTFSTTSATASGSDTYVII